MGEAKRRGTYEQRKAAAIASRENAERLLEDKKGAVEFTRVLAQLAQAVAQLRTIKMAHKEK